MIKLCPHYNLLPNIFILFLFEFVVMALMHVKMMKTADKVEIKTKYMKKDSLKNCRPITTALISTNNIVDKVYTNFVVSYSKRCFIRSWYSDLLRRFFFLKVLCNVLIWDKSFLKENK